MIYIGVEIMMANTRGKSKIQSNLDELPKSLILELLVQVKKYFCEGDKNSLDFKVYTALFENEVVVIPAGGHRNGLNYIRGIVINLIFWI